jgi:hypothetical protein
LNIEEAKMGTELAVIEPIPLPDMRRPDKMPSLPAWVVSRLECVSEETQKDASGNYRTVPVLPAAMMLGTTERLELELHAGALEKTLERTPDNTAAAEAETLVVITKMMLALPGMRSSETGAEAAGEAYQAALEDIPPWAVAAALRRWYRGDCEPIGKLAHDYRWRPAPAILRAIAFLEASKVRGRSLELKKLAAAVPAVEYSDEHKVRMLENLSGVMRGIFSPAAA